MEYLEGEESGITVGKLIEQLRGFKPTDKVCLGPSGYFTFYRVKDRGGIAQIEFNEAVGVHFDMLDEHPYKQHLKKQGIR